MSSTTASHARSCALVLTIVTAFAGVHAAEPPDPHALIAAEQQAMRLLDGFDGMWRGPAMATLAGGRQVTLTQTERVADGTVVFNAFGVMAYDPATGRYHFRSNAQGHGADLPIEISQDRFVWRLEAGPATIRYTATVKDGVWTEVGERLVDGQPPLRVYEMTLRRVGDTDWPAAGVVSSQ